MQLKTMRFLALFFLIANNWGRSDLHWGGGSSSGQHYDSFLQPVLIHTGVALTDQLLPKETHQAATHKTLQKYKRD